MDLLTGYGSALLGADNGSESCEGRVSFEVQCVWRKKGLEMRRIMGFVWMS